MPPWEARGAGVALAAADGAFDERTEEVVGSLDLSDLSLGRHLIFVTAVDQSGQRGVPTAVVLDFGGAPLFDDGFESGDTGSWDDEIGASR